MRWSSVEMHFQDCLDIRIQWISCRRLRFAGGLTSDQLTRLALSHNPNPREISTHAHVQPYKLCISLARQLAQQIGDVGADFGTAHYRCLTSAQQLNWKPVTNHQIACRSIELCLQQIVVPQWHQQWHAILMFCFVKVRFKCLSSVYSFTLLEHDPDGQMIRWTCAVLPDRRYKSCC